MEHVAVLIDCDNISRGEVGGVLAETARHGTLAVKRGYGDWTRAGLEGWKGELTRHAIQPVQQFAYVAGKNATDSALIIDAMDLLYAGNVGVFCLVSSDSDFTRLAVRLRESGRRVYGIGARHTPEAFRNACDRFTYLDLLPAPTVGDADASAQATDAPTDGAALGSPAELAGVFAAAVAASAGDDGWANLSSVGQYLVTTDPTFDSRAYGHAKLGTLAAEVPGVTVRKVATPNGSGQLWVSAGGRRAGRRAASTTPARTGTATAPTAAPEKAPTAAAKKAPTAAAKKAPARATAATPVTKPVTTTKKPAATTAAATAAASGSSGAKSSTGGTPGSTLAR